MCADGELVMGLSELCGDGCPQQLFGCPFSLQPLVDDLRDPGSCCPSAPVQLQSQPSALSSQSACGSPPCCHDDHCLPGSCFYQLHMLGGPFVPEDPDCAPSGATGGPHGLQVDFSLPSASPPSSTLLPSHFQVIGGLQHPPSALQHCSLTQWGELGVCLLSKPLIGVGFTTDSYQPVQDVHLLNLLNRMDLLPVLGGGGGLLVSEHSSQTDTLELFVHCVHHYCQVLIVCLFITVYHHNLRQDNPVDWQWPHRPSSPVLPKPSRDSRCEQPLLCCILFIIMEKFDFWGRHPITFLS